MLQYACNKVTTLFVSLGVQDACLLANGEPTRVGGSTVAEPSVDIIRRAQAGEPEALTQLILSQQHYVYSIAMSVLKNPEDAADLTQDAFVRLVRALQRFCIDYNIPTYRGLCYTNQAMAGKSMPSQTKVVPCRGDEGRGIRGWNVNMPIQ